MEPQLLLNINLARADDRQRPWFRRNLPLAFDNIPHKSRICVRRSIVLWLPTLQFFNSSGRWKGIQRHSFDFTNGQLVVPHPPTSREEIQEPFVREQQIDPAKYYPEGYHPELLEDWPVEGDLVVPLEKAPDDLTDGMGQEWRLRNKNRKILEEQGTQ